MLIAETLNTGFDIGVSEASSRLARLLTWFLSFADDVWTASDPVGWVFVFLLFPSADIDDAAVLKGHHMLWLCLRNVG